MPQPGVMMLDLLRQILGPWYLQIKFLHVLFVAVWIASTVVAYTYYLVPVFKAWRRNPHDQEIIALRNWTMERFDQGIIFEHVAFPIIILTGPLMYVLGGWTTATNWLLLKIILVCLVAIPIEIVDYHLSHFRGNKRRLREAGDAAGYERSIQQHWMFFLITSPPVMVFAVLIVFLAITKPF